MQTFEQSGNTKQCSCPRGDQTQSLIANNQMDFLSYRVDNTFTWDSQVFSAW